VYPGDDKNGFEEVFFCIGLASSFEDGASWPQETRNLTSVLGLLFLLVVVVGVVGMMVIVMRRRSLSVGRRGGEEEQQQEPGSSSSSSKKDEGFKDFVV
jgi:hypothetical protein